MTTRLWFLYELSNDAQRFEYTFKKMPIAESRLGFLLCRLSLPTKGVYIKVVGSLPRATYFHPPSQSMGFVGGIRGWLMVLNLPSLTLRCLLVLAEAGMLLMDQVLPTVVADICRSTGACRWYLQSLCWCWPFDDCAGVHPCHCSHHGTSKATHFAQDFEENLMQNSVHESAQLIDLES